MLTVLKYGCASPPELEPLATFTQNFLYLIKDSLVSSVKRPACRGIDSGRGTHANAHIAQRDHLAGDDFAGLAQFLAAIYFYVAGRDQHLAGAAALAQADQFQELVQFDIGVVQFKFQLLHGVPLYSVLNNARPRGRTAGAGPCFSEMK